MNKELIITIFIGIVLGFGLSALVWASNTEKTDLNLASSQQSPTPAEIVEVEEAISELNKNEDIFLNIIHPENEIISSQSTLLINGETMVNATVVAIWEKGQDILVADNDGEFETEIELIGGENLINISAYDNQGNKAAQTLTVTYSTAKF